MKPTDRATTLAFVHEVEIVLNNTLRPPTAEMSITMKIKEWKHIQWLALMALANGREEEKGTKRVSTKLVPNKSKTNKARKNKVSKTIVGKKLAKKAATDFKEVGS